MSSFNKYLSKLNEASTAIKSVKGISSKIFGTGYKTDISKSKEDSENERQRLLARAKELKSQNSNLNAIPRHRAKAPPKAPATELVYPYENPVDSYLKFTIFPRKKREQKNGPTAKNALSEGNLVIYLYAPNVPNNSPNVGYSTKNTGNITRALLENNVLGNGYFTTDFLKGLGAEGAEALAKINQALSLGTKDLKNRQVFNPQQEIVFEGMEFRSYDMTFQMRPQSATEALIIQDIVWGFKTAMLPDTFQNNNHGNVGSSFSENYYNMPNTVQVEWHGRIKGKLDGFLPSFITACNVTYNGSNKMETFEDGMPLVVDMTLSFQEYQLLTQERYQTITASRKEVKLTQPDGGINDTARQENIDSQLGDAIKNIQSGGSGFVGPKFQTSPIYKAPDGTVFKDGRIISSRPAGAG